MEPDQPNHQTDIASQHIERLRRPESHTFTFEQQRQRIRAALFGLETEPKQLAQYVVLDRLGSGGMGVVYAAYDRKLDRKVALKLIKTKGQPKFQARLQREAMAMARLTHPNVVQVYEFGEVENTPFITMEFVDGQTLRKWLCEKPRSYAEVLSVFVAAGRGLAAAHDVGLVHRDFKPDNVMIGNDGRVRVMDFGLAGGNFESTMPEYSPEDPITGPITSAGLTMGTPLYMAPEQWSQGPVSAAADQFGFCVALYAAMYGVHPFLADTLEKLRFAVSNGDIQPPPRGNKVPGWLRETLLRGLSIEPGERWPSMAVLLDALSDDPAKRRRRRWGIAAIVSLIGGTMWGIVGEWQRQASFCAGFEAELVGVWDDERKAAVQTALLSSELSYAPSTLQRVEGALDTYTEAWLAMRVDACEAHRSGAQSDALLDRRMLCLDDQLTRVRALVDELMLADPTAIENATKAVGELPRIEQCADIDMVMARIAPPDNLVVAQRVDSLDARLAQVEAKYDLGHWADALDLVGQIASEAEPLGYAPIMARTWVSEGLIRSALGDEQGTEAALERALFTALSEQMPSEAAVASSGLLLTVVRQARYDDARRWTKIAEALADAAGTNEALGSYHYVSGISARLQGHYGEAREHHEQALHLRRDAFGPQHPRVAASLQNLGFLADIEGDLEQAREFYERALSITEVARGPEHPDVASALMALGHNANSLGKYEEAYTYYDRARAILERNADQAALANALTGIGVTLSWQGKYDDAYLYHTRALAILERALGPSHPTLAISLTNLGATAENQGNYEEAHAHYERGLSILEQTLQPQHTSIAMMLINMGINAGRRGQYDEARGHLMRARSIYSTRASSRWKRGATMMPEAILSKP
jgi:serine/threonine protein kinase/tetratricopeptide (TPR) repeat protein